MSSPAYYWAPPEAHEPSPTVSCYCCFLQAAAVWLLECADLGAAQEAWHAAQQRQQEERRRAAQEREAAKKEIVNRFHLQVGGW